MKFSRQKLLLGNELYSSSWSQVQMISPSFCAGLCMVGYWQRWWVNLRCKAVVVLYNLQAKLFVVPVVGLTSIWTWILHRWHCPLHVPKLFSAKMMQSSNTRVGFYVSVSDEAAVAHLTPGPKHREMGFVGEQAPWRRYVHLNSVQVAQLTAVFCWGRQVCFVEPCSVDSGRAQTLEFPLGLWVLAPQQGHG